MAYRLKDRQKQIPNGMLFYQPQTKWKSTPWSSFSRIVDDLTAHRRANPHLGLSTDRAAVELEVDMFNAQVCAQMGWTDYITAADGGAVPAPPFPEAPPLLAAGNRLKNVAAGAEAHVEWLASGAEAVKPEVSAARGKICAECPVNGRGDLLRFFTIPVITALRAALNVRREWKLETPDDDKLGVCTACDCPLKLKVHFPIDRIRKNLKPQQKAALDAKCWIIHEP